MRVIGTAGHVDHGKSTLIAALTGVHPDRLKEEQAREMTIELGFGWLALPNGEEVGIVDVPGHRDFIENMLAGVGGIDAALLVIAADEGMMPQTKEHLAILDLLQIPAGLIVLAKIDLAPEDEWLNLLEKDIRAAVRGTILKDAPLVRVSAKQNIGLEELKTQLAALLETKPQRLNLQRPRLPIDRVFSMSGFGTVVTGTLSDGSLAIGDEVEILPSGLAGRIRGLQTHKKKEEVAQPGARTAVNISGVETEQIHRGDTLTLRGQYQTTRRIDARLRLLGDISLPIQQNQEVKFFIGASESLATLRLLGAEELNAGDEGWVQLELRDPVVAARKDRFILRRPSPAETLGGGVIVDAQPKGRHKRHDAAVIASLEALAKGSPADILFEAALALEIASVKEIVEKSRMETADGAWNELLQSGKIIPLETGEAKPNTLVAALPRWNALRDKALQTVGDYHRQYPLRRGIPREELKSKLKLAPRVFNALVGAFAARGLLQDSAGRVALPSHTVQFLPEDQKRVQALMKKFAANPYSTPSVKDCQAEIGEEVYAALLDLNQLVQVSADVAFRREDYAAMTEKVRAALMQNGQITLAETRDLFATTRKYAQAFLEYLDSTGVTMRAGDARKLRK
ncbi:MAG: selenocysteine-specific translation elongation factor [Anaerolineales bacterium]